MPGRKKQPVDLLLVKGKKHLTKEEIAKRREEEIKAPCNNIEPPGYFNSELRVAFIGYANTLIQIGIMSDLDIGALERYCIAEYEYREYTKEILNAECINDRYLEIKSLQGKAFKEARAAAGDLGLTISSRCRLVVPKTNEDSKPKNKYSKFM